MHQRGADVLRPMLSFSWLRSWLYPVDRHQFHCKYAREGSTNVQCVVLEALFLCNRCFVSQDLGTLRRKPKQNSSWKRGLLHGLESALVLSNVDINNQNFFFELRGNDSSYLMCSAPLGTYCFPPFENALWCHYNYVSIWNLYKQLIKWAVIIFVSENSVPFTSFISN